MKSLLSGVLIFTVSGLAIAAEVEPIKVDPVQGNLKHVAHIYYNVVTGEKITTLIGDQDTQRGVDGVLSEEIWAQTTSAMCSDFGDTGTFFYPMDDPSDTSTLNNYVFDWGGIAMDTVVDCVQINWVTNHQDADLDNDGNADGVVGFGGSWTYWDAYNGATTTNIIISECVSLPLITINFYNLPGELSDPLDQNMAFYTADIDLGVSGSFGTSLIFEIGDTDSDLQGAAVHNANMDESFNGLPGVPDFDQDGDGLADWAWSLVFSQPGSVDVDNADGDNNSNTGVDGDVNALAMTGAKLAAPTPGYPEYNSGDDSWEWISDGPTAGKTFDSFGTAYPAGGSSVIFDGPFSFGGLDCTPGESGYVPAAMFQTVLYGPGNEICCCVDLNQDGQLDFFDISFFLNNSVDYNEDTVFDFFDISNFLGDFGAGCP